VILVHQQISMRNIFEIINRWVKIRVNRHNLLLKLTWWKHDVFVMILTGEYRGSGINILFKRNKFPNKGS
jgi:hypothetical protein